MTETLEDAIADERGQAQVLRAKGYSHDALLIERLCDRFAAAAEDYLRFLSEPEAELRSARATEWFRSRFAGWEEMGHAKKVNGKRYYRMLVIPQRANLSAVREEGRRIGMQKAG